MEVKTTEKIVLELMQSTKSYVARRIQDDHNRQCYTGAVNGIYHELTKPNLTFDEMRIKVTELSNNLYAFSPNMGSRASKWRRYWSNDKKYVEMAFEHVRDIFYSMDKRFITGYHSQYVYHKEYHGLVA